MTAGNTGLVIVLAGEADYAGIAELNMALEGELATDATTLTVDASALRFADCQSVRALVLAARSLRDRGGRLVAVLFVGRVDRAVRVRPVRSNLQQAVQAVAEIPEGSGDGTSWHTRHPVHQIPDVLGNRPMVIRVRNSPLPVRWKTRTPSVRPRLARTKRIALARADHAILRHPRSASRP